MRQFPQSTMPLAILLVAVFIPGCHRLRVATDVYARICHPLKVETTKPIQIETGLIPEKKKPLTEITVRHAAPQSSGRVVIIDIDGLLVNENLGSPISINENPVSLFREKLAYVANDATVSAIVLRINSPGGGVTASDIMRRELEQFRCRHSIPVVACVLDVGAGGAYYVASAADEIFAHPTSLIGGIGVLLNLYNLETMMEFFNVVSVSVKAGKKVDLGSPVRPIPEENRALLQSIADEFHLRFIEIVRNSRGSLLNGEEMFDGRVCTAPEAQEKGLIDSIGYLEDAIRRAEDMGNCTGGSVVLLNRRSDTVRTPYDVLLQDAGAEFSFFPSIPGVQRSKLPTFLYIWQADPSLTADIGG